MLENVRFLDMDELSTHINPLRFHGVKVTTQVVNESNTTISYMDPVYGPVVIHPHIARPADAHNFLIITTITCCKSIDLLAFYKLKPDFVRVLKEKAKFMDGLNEYTYMFGLRINIYGVPHGTMYRDPLTGLVYAVGDVNWLGVVRDHVIEYANERRYSDIQGIEYVSDVPDDAVYLAGVNRVKRIPAISTKEKRRPHGVHITRMNEEGSLEVIFNSDTSSCREESNVPIFDTVQEAEDYMHHRGASVADAPTSRAKKGSTAAAPVKLSPQSTLRQRLDEYDRLREEARVKRAAARAKSTKPSEPTNYDLAEPYGVTRRASESVLLRFAQFAFSYIARLTHTNGWGKWAFT